MSTHTINIIEPYGKKIAVMVLFCSMAAAFAVEGIDPPKRQIDLDLEVSEHNSAKPGEYIEIFTEPYNYFLTVLPTQSTFDIFAFAATKGAGGGGRGVFPRGNATVYASLDSLSGKRAAAFGQANYATKLGGMKLNTNFAGDYGGRHLVDSNRLERYPRFYDGSIAATAMYPFSRGLATLFFGGSAFYQKEIPGKSKDPKNPDVTDYKEIIGYCNARFYAYIAPKAGAFAEGGYTVARKGEDFLPARGKTACGGGFYISAPLILRVGVGLATCDDTDENVIRPSASLRWSPLPYFFELDYGTGVRANGAHNFVDEASIAALDYSEGIAAARVLPFATVDTVAVFVGSKIWGIDIKAGGVYGTSSAHPMINQTTLGYFSLNAQKITIATAWCKAVVNKKIHMFNIENSLDITIDKSKLDSGNPLPFTSKSVYSDTFSVFYRNIIGLKVCANAHSGFHALADASDYRKGFTNAAISLEYRNRGMRIALGAENLLRETVIDFPLYMHDDMRFRFELGYDFSIVSKPKN